MAASIKPGKSRALRLGAAVGEISGAFGDLGVFLPYVVAAVGVGVVAPGPVFFGFAIGYLLVALVYRRPIAVQPMKALGAMIIAGGLSSAEIAWSGALIGAALLALAASPFLTRAARAIPQSVVTGLQAGLGLVLARAALAMMAEDWLLAAGALGLLALSFVWRRGPWALGVIVLAALVAPVPPSDGVAPGMIASTDPASPAAILAAIAGQLPLTLLNAVVVAAAVARALYPEARGIEERRLAATSGLLNLALAPFGALPMCHGAGGAAAHHRFGARGIGAPLILATLCAAAALFGADMMRLLSAIPSAAVGALLAFAAGGLILTPRMVDARPDCRPVIGAAALATLGAGALAGLVAGLVAERIRAHLRRKRNPRPAA